MASYIKVSISSLVVYQVAGVCGVKILSVYMYMYDVLVWGVLRIWYQIETQ